MVIMRELGRVKQVVEEACGLEITHFYDDIVLVEHSAFLIRFDQVEQRDFHVYFNRDCRKEDRLKILSKLLKASEANGMYCIYSGSFSMEPKPGQEEIEISFYEPAG